MTTATAKMVVTVGAWVRNDIKAYMEDLAFTLDLKLVISETPKFLGSRLRVTVEGPEENVDKFIKGLESKTN